MNDEYENLKSRAVRGEKDSLRELFALADEYKNQGKLQKAVEAFRESAVAYRISGFRNLNRAETAESQSAWQTKVNEIYRRWIENNPNGLRKLPFPACGLTTEDIRQIVVHDLFSDGSFDDIFWFLESKLGSLGMQFFSPGGSIQRRVVCLLSEAFGVEDFDYAEYLSNLEVRVGLDLLADEVAKRLGQDIRPNEQSISS